MPRWAVVTLSIFAGVVLVVVLGLLAWGGGDEASSPQPITETAATEPPEVEPGTTQETTTQETTTEEDETRELRVNVRGGAPVGGIQRLTVRQGEEVRVRVTADVAEEVHLHGYDLSDDVGPGEPAEIELEATLTGRFEIELEHSGTPIAELEVRP